MSETQLRNVSNPAAFGVEWRDETTAYQRVNSRGTESLVFGIKGDDGHWITSPVVSPERLGLRAAPRSTREFLAIARAFTQSGRRSVNATVRRLAAGPLAWTWGFGVAVTAAALENPWFGVPAIGFAVLIVLRARKGASA